MNYQHYNGDFEVIYCELSKRNYWLLGEFGGGSLNAVDAMNVAKDYAEATGVALESVVFNEVNNSRFCQYFKYCYSQTEQTPMEGALQVNDFHSYTGR